LTVLPRLAVIASIALFATAPSLLGQGLEGRAYENRDINDGARGWFGVWRLNVDKSVYNPGPAPYKRATMKVERVDDEVRFSYDFVHLRGGVQHLEWTGNFDGNDYIVQGIDEYMTYAYKQVDARTYEIVAKADGQVAAVATVTISPDGRTLTTVTRRKNGRGQDITTTTIYDKIR
jgi:hypothetical protein